VSDPRPIGVFDSGVGGLTVLREIVRRLPGESTIYLGDNARTPYGTRSDEEVLAFSSESVAALVARDVKAIVIACNTSTAVALPNLRRRYELPILGVIRPGAAAAALASRNRRVGVIATPATVRSHAYFWAIKEENPAIEVYEHATPSLVPLVEAGQLTGPSVERAVGDELAPLLGERDTAGEFVFPLPASARIDTLLLGCTHYPLLRPVIEAIAGDRVAIVDSATATASALAELLGVNGLEAAPATAVHRQLTTGHVASFSALATRLFGKDFTDVAAIELQAADNDHGDARSGALGAAAPTATGGNR
jgi:glutamate racemase